MWYSKQFSLWLYRENYFVSENTTSLFVRSSSYLLKDKKSYAPKILKEKANTYEKN